jgi:hypothetical protein
VILGIAIVNMSFWFSVESTPLSVSIIPVYRVFVCIMGSRIILTLRSKRERLARGKLFSSVGMTTTSGWTENGRVLQLQESIPLSPLSGSDQRESGRRWMCNRSGTHYTGEEEGTIEDEDGPNIIELSHLSYLWYSRHEDHPTHSMANRISRTQRFVR